MARHRFVVEGVPEPASADSPLRNADAGDAPVFAAILATARAGTAAVSRDLVTPVLADDDLVEIALDGGGHLWLSVAEFEAVGYIDLQAARNGAPKRVRARLVGSAATRGIGDAVIHALRFFRIDLPDRLARAGRQRLVDAIEDTLGTAPGLYRLNDAAAAPVLEPLGARARFDDQPYLLFIHGTNSSTAGSFGDLWSVDGGAAIGALRTRYGRGHLLALQHRSLSESPLDNALQVARAIPDGVRLDLLTHSRGGLVGELLARATVAPDEAPFDEVEFAAWRKATSPAAAKALRDLSNLLARRRYPIERFVRVACPARGTTLASGKLERWCNVLLNLAGATLAAGAPATAPLFLLLKATLKRLVAIDDLPGLAAMAPSSPLVRLLNAGTRPVGADLHVVGGDTDGGNAARRVALLLVDAFFGGANDLVVDTNSMTGGTPRRAAVHASLLRAPDIHHLCCFRHPVARERILRALCEADPLRRHAGYAVVDPQPAPTRAPVPLRPLTRSGNPDPPIVFVLPGIMGTHLRVKDERVWLDYGQLVFGGFGKLGIDARQVVPDGLDGDTYADLVDFLGRSHEVVPFGYDWRLPVEDAAARLNAALLAKLAAIDRERQPIRLVAHSMGGLVARAMMLRADSAWPAMCRHAGARLIMLGTPNSGSHAITQLLFGEEKLVRMLAAVDLGHDLGELVGRIARFPGPLDMLPADAAPSYFDAATWTGLARRTMPERWPLPTPGQLARAQAWRQGLAAQVLDPQRVFYVAGQAEATPIAIEVEATRRGERLRFRATRDGDGRVPWDGGIPPGVRAWYVDARHGDLASHARAHAGYLDILEHGDTSATALRTQRPATASRGGADAGLLREASDVPSLPDADAFARAAAGRERTAVTMPARAALPVTVAWGDLANARHAVMVGHYEGDSIISAEAALDRALGGRLARQHRLGTYPGAIGSALVVLDPGARPPGVVVVGLGAIGRLTPGDLGAAVARGLVEWIAAREDARAAEPTGATGGGISLLLIGSGEGGVDADTAVYSILRGVLEGIERGRRAGLAATPDSIEFVELFQDRAHRLWHALDRLLDHGELRGRFVLAGPLAAIGDGRTRLWEAAPAGWWRRLQVTAPETPDDATRRELAFTSLTDSARSETWHLPFQAEVVDTLVAASIADTTRDEAREKALFELILPNAIKERAPQRESLVLLLDRATANLPWELLSDPFGGDGDDARPLAVRAGLVRQFATATFRVRPSVVVDNTALVIGDPIAPRPQFAELDGARREAAAVADVLLANGRFAVEHLVQPHGEAVVQTLLPRPFRILHIAGHGMLADDDLDRDSGIVLDAFNLTWASLDQLRAIPELVFINCCHLGRVAAGSDDHALSRRNRFAAGVGEVFIRNGARAVIAAGWAVDDLGAETFARAFYARMLAGERFGVAVQGARAETFAADPRSNTWGAYQCYGDPDYRLLAGGGEAAASPPPRHASIEELVTAAIDTLALRVPTDAGERDRLRERIDALLVQHADLVDAAQADTTRLHLALARAWARGGFVDEAIAAYARVQAQDTGTLALGDCERLAGLLLARAADPSRPRRTGRAGAAPVDEAIAATTRVLAFAPTRARLALLGDAWQVAARQRRGAARRRALRAAHVAWSDAAAITESPTADDDAARAAVLAALETWHAPTGSAPRRARGKAKTARRASTRHPLELLAGVLATGSVDASAGMALTEARAAADPSMRAAIDTLAAYASGLLADLRGKPPRALAQALAAWLDALA